MNILITRHDKIGDFITALPMCKIIKQQTNHKVIILVSSINMILAKNINFIDHVIEYSSNTLVLMNRIKKYKIDLSISSFININLGFTLFLARIPTRIAPATKIAQIFFNKTLIQRRSNVMKKEWQYNLDLLHKFDKKLKLVFDKPLLEMKNEKNEKNLIIFHVGSGGSSDGNLKLNDYVKLASCIPNKYKIAFTFGPNDKNVQKYIKNNTTLYTIIKDDFNTIYELTKYISTAKLFISTSTGPMHLAGLVNTPTISFFGNSLFASSKRWATISEENLQNNFEVPNEYNEDFYLKIENKLLELLK